MFSPFGVSGVVVLGESHLAVHAWPEYRFVAVDVSSCGEVLQPQHAADHRAERLGATRTSAVELGLPEAGVRASEARLWFAS